MFFDIAFKNLWRNKRRTLITEISVVFGMIVIIFTGSVTNGLTRRWAVKRIESHYGSMQVEHRDYQKKQKIKPLETTIKNGWKLQKKIEAFPHVFATFGQLNIRGLISNGSNSRMFFGRGVNIEDMRKTLPGLKSDLGLSAKTGRNEILLGPKLAEDLGVKIGDPVMLLVNTIDGALNVAELIYVGNKSPQRRMSGDYESAHYVELHLSIAQDLLMMRDRISQIVVGYENFEQIEEAALNLEIMLNQESETPLVVKDYRSLIPGFEITHFFSLIGIVVGFISFIIVGTGIANSIAQSPNRDILAM